MLLVPLLCLTGAGVVLGASADAATYRQLAKENGGIVRLDSALYDQITAEPRDYSVSIVLTAMAPQFKCGPCVSFAPEHALVAKSWASSPKRDMHFFAVLDFPDGTAVYQKLGLQTAPTFQLWRPTVGDRATNSGSKFESVDFAKVGFRAESVASHLQSSAGLPLKFSRPLDKGRLATTIASFAVILTTAIVAWPTVQAILLSKYLWAAASILTILTMTSGFMWNQIRNPPYSQPADHGQISYVAGGYSNQFGAETHILMGVYGILGFAAYTLAFIVPRVSDPVKQRLGVYVWTLISVVMLGVLMSLFSIKQGGYPFRFF